MDNGDINSFIKKHGDVNRVQLVRFHIHSRKDWYNRVSKLVDATHGLQYLHNFSFAHGDLKGVC